jgi:hypothetical protein
VPFVPVGLLADAPWWFDDVERIQRSLLDMHSAKDTAIHKAVFPLLVVPESMQRAMQIEQLSSDQARVKIGLGHPISEAADESGITRWLSGTTVDLAFIRQEIDRLADELFRIVGLAMSVPESRQVASAEAKQWDHLDPEAVLRERATLLEEAEHKVVELTAAVGGPTFRPYTPVYGKQFDVSDFEADLRAIASAGGMSLPPKAEKLLQKAAVAAAGKRFRAKDDEVDAALTEIDEYEPPNPFAGFLPRNQDEP